MFKLNLTSTSNLTSYVRTQRVLLWKERKQVWDNIAQRGATAEINRKISTGWQTIHISFETKLYAVTRIKFNNLLIVIVVL